MEKMEKLYRKYKKDLLICFAFHKKIILWEIQW